MQDRHRRTDRPTVLRLVVAAVLTAIAVLVLRAPMDVLVTLLPTTPATRSAATDDTGSPSRGGSDAASIGRVGDRDAGGVASEEEGDAVVRAPDDVTQGRFGTSAPRPTTALVIEELRGGWRVESGVEEAAALAVIAGHTWAATSGATTAARDASQGAIVTVEAVERPGAHHAVVTLLIAAGGAASQLHRIAVPVLLDADGPTIAGAPWVLPAPMLRTSSVASSAIGDVELIAAARRALEGVGIPGERMVALEVTDGWPFIARLDDEADGHPWLRWHVDRFVVAGLPLDAGRGRDQEDDRLGGSR